MMPLQPLLLRGDCLVELAKIPDESVDAVVTDPPYGLANTDPAHVVEALTRWAQGDRSFIPSGRGFMGKEWDAFVPPPAVWDECARILKPGGHLLAFAGSRTFDLMTLSIRFAGFDIRDSIAWLYGSGFPKSMDVSKAIDKAAGVEFEARPASGVGFMGPDGPGGYNVTKNQLSRVGESTDAAREWEGWGTALKPAFEPIVVARKPFPGTVAANVLAHGTGALNIDATRISHASEADLATSLAKNPGRDDSVTSGVYGGERPQQSVNTSGRWPANVVLEESQAAALDAQSGTFKSAPTKSKTPTGNGKTHGVMGSAPDEVRGYTDSGGASRFFYVAKAPKSERPVVNGVSHATVKPLTIMRWLLRLVTPEGGCIVDPFAGSGTTLEAAYLEGFESIGVEMTPDYWPLIAARIERVTK